MASLSDYLKLIRVQQWYKNLVIFLALFFAGNLFEPTGFILTVIGLISLCLISSVNYIINDIIDIKRDQHHPEKGCRPLASGKININSAIFILILLLVASFLLARLLPFQFSYFLIGLFVLSQVYTLFLKHIAIADVLTIATLFVLRALSGAYILNIEVSPWLILCPFFLSLFLSVGKRHADISLLKEKAVETRRTLKDYNHQYTNSLIMISTTLLVISYSLYSFLSVHRYLLFTLPFALFVIFRYYLLIQSGSIIARHPHKGIHDKSLLIGTALWVVVTFFIIYWF